jgi:Uma2 family endonuclease
MSTAAAPGERFLTVEEYSQLRSNGRRTELVRGRIVVLNPPYPWQGYVCGKVDSLIGSFVREHDLGYVVLNDSGVITERDPDSVRGADFAFYSYTQVPNGNFPKRGYLNVPPDLVVAVRSPDDRWKNIPCQGQRVP